ncbi:histidine kinase-, DNA gyrase B-, and HSP90-like ATPase family protein [Tanacetum coccineum]
MYGQRPPQFTYITGQPPYLNHHNYLHNLYYHPPPYAQPPPQQPYPNLPIQNPNLSYGENVMEQNVYIMKIGKAVTKARRGIVSSGEHVSSAKVVEDVVLELNVDQWDSIGVKMQDVPPLFRLMQLEKKDHRNGKKFLCKLGVSDFVRIVEVKKGVWDSQELTHLLSHVSSNGDKEKSKYLLRVLNQLWDSNFGNKPFTSYVINILNGVQWLVSDKDTQLHFPKVLFRDSELVRDILSDTVPYAVPKKSKKSFLGPDKTDVVGLFFIPKKVYWQWHDPIVSLMEQTNSPDSQSDQSMTHRSLSNRLCDVYPGLHDFFVNELGVAENPPLRIYLPSLIQCLSTGSLPSQAVKTDHRNGKKFLCKLGVSDFVRIVEVKKGVWDSQELTHLLSHISSKGDKEKSKYLLKVLNQLWDSNFGNKPYTSYVTKILNGVQWLVSDKDTQLHFPKDLFHDCELVREVVNDRVPYVVPKVNNVKFVNDIGLKNTITLDDALSLLDVWRRSKPFRASISQMSKLYTCIWNEMSISKQKIVENLHSQAFIFIPQSYVFTNEVVIGLFLSPNEVYWHDEIVSLMEQTRFDKSMTHRPFSNMLCNVYPGLHDFFVNELGVAENPPLRIHLPSLIQCLSTGSLPSQAVKTKCMEEKEMKILPTMQDEWVSLHQSFGLVCWFDDEQLGNQYKNLNNVHFISFGELTTQEKQIFQDKVSVLFRILGIPYLSEVVTRDVICDGLMDSNSKASLINSLLPYAQRYIYSVHPNVYAVLKDLWGFKHPSCLRVVEVKKLVYKNVIKKYGIESNKWIKCGCLLQDSVLYTTKNSDTHSLFRELSRFLLAGFPELPLANFLQMIITMRQSGSLVDKMEIFISGSQKLLSLPCEESEWSVAYSSAQIHGVTERLINTDGDWIIKGNPASSSMIPSVILEEDEAAKEVSDSVIDMNVGFKGQLDYMENINSPPLKHANRKRETGWTGEFVAFRYFSAKFGENCVKWVNEVKESGLPYDIVIEGDDNSKEYIEVKATSHAWKDWFPISVREWDFNRENGDSFYVARVVISDGNSAQITTYRNPAKMCQLKQLHLQLAINPNQWPSGKFVLDGWDLWSYELSTCNQWTVRNRLQLGDTIVYMYEAKKRLMLKEEQEDLIICTIRPPAYAEELGEDYLINKLNQTGPNYSLCGMVENYRIFIVFMIGLRLDKSSPPPRAPARKSVVECGSYCVANIVDDMLRQSTEAVM